MEISVLQWDSDFFKRPVVKIDIGKHENIDVTTVIEECKKQGYKLLYFFLDGDNKSMADKLSALLGQPINQKLVFTTTNLNPDTIKSTLDTDLTVINANQSKKGKEFDDQILQLTIKAGLFSRFNIDDQLDKEYFESMYAIWTSAMLNDSNYRIIIARHKNEKSNCITGFLSYKIIEEGYKIDFMSINENYQKKGIGKALLRKMMEEVNGQGSDFVITEIHRANDSAYHFFLSNGFSLIHAVNIYHVHL